MKFKYELYSCKFSGVINKNRDIFRQSFNAFPSPILQINTYIPNDKHSKISLCMYNRYYCMNMYKYQNAEITKCYTKC